MYWRFFSKRMLATSVLFVVILVQDVCEVSSLFSLCLMLYCHGVECRAVLGSAQKGSGAATIPFIYIFRAYTESMA